MKIGDKMTYVLCDVTSCRYCETFGINSKCIRKVVLLMKEDNYVECWSRSDNKISRYNIPNEAFEYVED